MSGSNDRHRRQADALEALARGRQVEPAGADEPGPQAEADGPAGPSSGLMLLSEGEQEVDRGEDFLDDLVEAEDEEGQANPSLGELAAASGKGEASEGADLLRDLSAELQGQENPNLGELAAASGRGEGAAPISLGDVAAGAAGMAEPAFQAQRATRRRANLRHSHLQAYKKAMIPLSIVVGLLLFAASAVTLVMLLKRQADDLAGELTYLRAYGKYFILAALPLGAILLMGAWWFYVDVKRSESRRAR